MGRQAAAHRVGLPVWGPVTWPEHLHFTSSPSGRRVGTIITTGGYDMSSRGGAGWARDAAVHAPPLSFLP